MLDTRSTSLSPRRLTAEDFSAGQISDWIEASARSAGPDFGLGAEDAAAEREWFVAYTNPKREISVERTCRQRGFEAYVPAMTVTARRKGAKASAQRPVFPRYVFVRLRDGLTLYGLRETPGLEALVRVSGKPVTVPGEMVDGLRAYETNGTWDFTDARAAEAKAAAMREAYREGRKVRIAAGPFLSFHGVIKSFRPDGTLMVRIAIFGRASLLPLPLAHVELL